MVPPRAIRLLMPRIGLPSDKRAGPEDRNGGLQSRATARSRRYDPVARDPRVIPRLAVVVLSALGWLTWPFLDADRRTAVHRFLNRLVEWARVVTGTPH